MSSTLNFICDRCQRAIARDEDNHHLRVNDIGLTKPYEEWDLCTPCLQELFLFMNKEAKVPAYHKWNKEVIK